LKVQISSDGVHWTDISDWINPVQHMLDVYEAPASYQYQIPSSVSFYGSFKWHGFGEAIINGISRGLKPSSHRHIMQRKIRRMVRNARSR
jgi:hypothetical protein